MATLDKKGLERLVTNIKTLINNNNTYLDNKYVAQSVYDLYRSEMSTAMGEKANSNDVYIKTETYTQAETKSYVADKINELGVVFNYMGSTTADGIATLLNTADRGDVYNVTENFTTTSSFIEGAGKTYSAGTNIVRVSNPGGGNAWDVLGTTVDLSGYVEEADITPITDNEIDALFT